LVALVQELERSRVAVPIAQHQRRIVRDCNSGRRSERSRAAGQRPVDTGGAAHCTLLTRYGAEIHARKRNRVRALLNQCAISLTCAASFGVSEPASFTSDTNSRR